MIADGRSNDPTIRWLLAYAEHHGFGAIFVINLYSFRASRPSAMMMNDSRLGELAAHYCEQGLILAKQPGNALLIAWGNHGDFEGRGSWFINRAAIAHSLSPLHLGRTKQGQPMHPMARGKHRLDPRNSAKPWFGVL